MVDEEEARQLVDLMTRVEAHALPQAPDCLLPMRPRARRRPAGPVVVIVADLRREPER